MPEITKPAVPANHQPHTADGQRPAGAAPLFVPPLNTCSDLKRAGYPQGRSAFVWARHEPGGRTVRGKIQLRPGHPFSRPLAWSESPKVGDVLQYVLLRREDVGEHRHFSPGPEKPAHDCCVDAPLTDEIMACAPGVVEVVNVRFGAPSANGRPYHEGGFSGSNGYIGGGRDRNVLVFDNSANARTAAEAAAIAWIGSELEAGKRRMELQARRQKVIDADNCRYCPRRTLDQLRADEWAEHELCKRCGGPCAQVIAHARNCDHCGRAISRLTAECTLLTFFRTRAHKPRVVGLFRENPRAGNECAEEPRR